MLPVPVAPQRILRKKGDTTLYTAKERYSMRLLTASCPPVEQDHRPPLLAPLPVTGMSKEVYLKTMAALNAEPAEWEWVGEAELELAR
jgi:hypothetical protein